MDTRSTKHKFSFTVLVYLVAFSLLITGVFAGLFFFDSKLYKDDYADTEAFSHSVNYLLNDCVFALRQDTNPDPPYLAAETMRYEMTYRWSGVNIYIRNNYTGIEYTNSGVQSPEAFKEIAADNEFTLLFGDGEILVYRDGELRRDLSGYIRYDESEFYTEYGYGYDYSRWNDDESGSLKDKLIYITIPQIRGFSSVYTENHYALWKNSENIALVIAAVAVALILCITAGHNKMRAFGQSIAAAIKAVPFELKYLFGGGFLFLIAVLYTETLDNLSFFTSNIFVQVFRFALILGCVIVWNILWWDLRYNGLKTFAVNIPSTLYRMVKRQNMRFPFQKKIQRQFIITFCILILCGILCIFTFFAAFGTGFPPFLLVSVFLFLSCLVIVYKLVSDYFDIISQLGKIIGHINVIAHGTTDEPLPELTPMHDLYPLYYAIRGMQTSVQNAIDSRLQSEKMKVDLITNVSHDLKTPLTSIITYTDLLKREELSETQREYVSVIDEKSQRLKVLMSDIFDLSKASSGNIKLEMQRICVNHLLSQTVAENADVLESAGITAIVNQTDELFVNADGEKLYRVFENLLINISKYALAGSRAYIDLVCQDNKVRVIFKNTSNYPMNFSGEQMKEKFVQGDISRNTDGSGLGLAICDRFAEVMGGDLDIVVDGDLFKAIVTFPQA
ncbi:MAG: HAMP domain-containing histidine kinase [Oscillospiraceae bacterium]|nr:HAMP domain-containing histidine kinase [Oscillospiraceae bacterium]